MGNSYKNTLKIFYRIRENKIFQGIIIFTIIFSSLIIGAKTFEGFKSLQIFQYLDNIITIIFVSEVIIKMLAEKKWHHYFKDNWNIFDFIIITLSLIPMPSAEYVIIGRLLRVFRILRLITFVDELKFLINSLLKSLKSIFYISVLLFIIFYIYAAIGSVAFASINPDLWGNIMVSTLTLFNIMTLEGRVEIMNETMEVYPLSWIYFVSFIVLTVFTFLNLLIGAIITAVEDERKKQMKKTIKKAEKNIEKDIEKMEKKLDKISKQLTKITK